MRTVKKGSGRRTVKRGSGYKELAQAVITAAKEDNDTLFLSSSWCSQLKLLILLKGRLEEGKMLEGNI